MRFAIGLLATALLCLGQQTITLRGTVDAVDVAGGKISVANEPIPGGMGSMTMRYSVDKPEVLHQLKPGDKITAKYRDGDMTLYEVQVVKAPAAAKNGPGLGLEELERMALASNPTIAQVEANVRASSGLARQASLYPNPTVGYYGDEIRGGSWNGGKQGGFVSQTIITGGKLQAARRVANLATEEAKTSGEAQRLRIVTNVRMLFYEVLAQQRLVEVRERMVKLAEDSAATSKQLANIGQADRPDVLQTEVEQQQAIVGLRMAQQNLRASWRVLAAVIGKPELGQAPLEGDLDAIPELRYDDWLATSLRENPELKRAQQEVDKAAALLIQAQRAPIPDLQLYGNLTQNFEPLETGGKAAGLVGGVQIGVQLPLFNRNQGGIAAAKGGIESARQELIRLKLRITREIATQFREYEGARATVEQYRQEMLPRAEEAYRLYSSNYKSMAGAYPPALLSQRTLFQLQLEYVRALETAWQSALEIRGFGLLDGLAASGL